MTRVVFPDNLANRTGGVRELELEVADFRALLKELEARFPEAGEAFRRSAVAIDGQIYQDAFLEPLDTAGEVFFMQRIEGG